jgi:hypothetical protein
LPRSSMAGAFSIHGSDEQILALMNKSAAGDERLRKRSALHKAYTIRQSGRGFE